MRFLGGRSKNLEFGSYTHRSPGRKTDLLWMILSFFKLIWNRKIIKPTREYVEYGRLATGPSDLERHSVNSSNQSSMGGHHPAINGSHPNAPCNNSFFKAGSTWHVCHVPVRMSFANLVQNQATQPPRKNYIFMYHLWHVSRCR